MTKYNSSHNKPTNSHNGETLPHEKQQQDIQIYHKAKFDTATEYMKPQETPGTLMEPARITKR